MALTINQGTPPGPNNLDPVDPATEIEAWVAGTTIFNIPNSAFRGGGLSFVFTQTDPPASAERFNGLLWFKRGEGRLYKWDVPDSPTGLTFTASDWLCLTDRREMWVFTTDAVRQGAVMIPNGTKDLLTRSPMSAGARNTSRMILQCNEVHSADKQTLTEVCFVAMDSRPSNSLVKVTDVGFTSVLMRAGTVGTEGMLYLQDTGASHVGEFYVSSTFTHPTNPGQMHFAIGVGTAGNADAGAPWLRANVFKRIAPPIGSNQYYAGL